MPTPSLNPTPLEDLGAAMAMGGLLLSCTLLRPWYSRWGLEDGEATRPLPGDEIVPQPTLEVTRAVTIQAPAERIWPWIAQIGHGRAGLYTYERLENLARCQMKNADRIVLEWQRPRPGDNVRLGPKGYPLFRIVAIDPGRALVMQACDPAAEQPGPASWAFVLEPLNDRTTRLLARSRNGVDPTFGNLFIWKGLVEPVHFVMERRMLIGIQRRAEAMR
jgi:hypothetical protein